MTETTDTIDPQAEAVEPKFTNCWVDDEREIIQTEIGGVTFRLRSITVGEERRIADELALELTMPAKKKELPEEAASIPGAVVMVEEVPAVIRMGDFTRRMILNVGAALGMWKKYSSEGWSDSRPVSPENVEALKGDVLTKLWLEHVKYFRCV
jgi:hypothetical protein